MTLLCVVDGWTVASAEGKASLGGPCCEDCGSCIPVKTGNLGELLVECRLDGYWGEGDECTGWRGADCDCCTPDVTGVVSGGGGASTELTMGGAGAPT